ncbi:MAG: peptidoglycan-associated lipoprotein Pal [Desulfobacterales bacterium]|jgi:peptidoglycan-associated lipoprotein
MGIMLILAAAGCQKKIIDSGSALSGPGAGADGAGVAGDTDDMREEDLSAARAGGEGPVDEIVTADGVVMNRELFINQDIFFAFDSSALSAEAQSILKAKAEWMSRNTHLSIIIEGHCDNRGTTEYNLALGERRAEGVKRFMQDLGVAESRIRTLSFGEERPLALGDSEDAWAKNRRAHFEFD